MTQAKPDRQVELKPEDLKIVFDRIINKTLDITKLFSPLGLEILKVTAMDRMLYELETKVIDTCDEILTLEKTG